MISVFYVIYIIWVSSEILINRLLLSGTADKKNLDDNTLRTIWITIAVATTLAVTISNLLFLPIFQGVIVRYIGLGLILLGCLLRFLTIRSLGREFTADVTIRTDHRLKTDGIYYYLRHPSYSCSILSFIGFGLSLNNWVSLIILVVSVKVR
jgi:protein-S-isoprenylcysteine O-methyltransferase Ste14